MGNWLLPNDGDLSIQRYYEGKKGLGMGPEHRSNETSARAWCTGKTQKNWVEREVGDRDGECM